jgi:hypothetical protein
MKSLFIFSILLVVFICFAETKITSEMTLAEISMETAVPMKKLKLHLGLEKSADQSIPLKDFSLSVEDVTVAVEKFDAEKKSFLGGTVLAGMLIVFSSLILIGLIINQLQHLNKFDKKAKKKSKSSKTKPVLKDMNSDSLVAAMTTIFLHEMDVEEQNKLHLTWKRAGLSSWRSAILNNSPNRTYDLKR